MVALGRPGVLERVELDTHFFKGNAPQEVALEGIDAPLTATAEALEAATGWFEVLPRQAVKPDFPNVLRAKAPSARVTHVRLRIFPDGGVSRLRACGRMEPEP